MFQYAAGRALAAMHNAETLLDIRQFHKYRLHNGFELARIFSIDAPVAAFEEIKKIIGWRATRIGHRIVTDRRLSFLRGNCFYIEKDFSYDSNFFSLPDNCYISGYWQSYKYFSDFESIIREQFQFRPKILNTNNEFSQKIQSCNAVSLHFRRGDYVSNSGTNTLHGTCSIDYYYSAIDYVSKFLSDPVFFIFSDDIDWVKQNFPINNNHYFATHNVGFESYNDMRLMSMCDHHIIANSSFSWWGAWLNPSKDKLVIAPKRWFNDPTINTRDLIPETWVRI